MTARAVPLGGLGEFGANSLLVECGAEGRVLVDAGAAFVEGHVFGVAMEVPDFAALGGPAPAAVVVTHGHDDHGRGLGVLCAAYPRIRVLGTRATLARVRRDAEPPPDVTFQEIGDRRESAAGVGLEFMPVSHSIPGTVMTRLFLEGTPAVVATDFRLTPSALGETTSAERLDRWGGEGVGVLFLDATNALVEAAPPSETTVGEVMAEQVSAARGAVVVVTFASHVGRFLQAARAAVAAGRVVVPVGRGMVESLEIQAILGGLGLPPGVVRRSRELADLPRDGVVLVATGSQGEPGSAFSSMALDRLPGFHLRRGDTVLHAARVIPGSERRLASVFDDCVRLGARIVTASDAPLHASGHPHRAELEELLALLRPRCVVPIHGRRRHLAVVSELAARHGARAVVVENGEELELVGGGAEPTGEHRGVGRVLLGEQGEVSLDPGLLHQRRALARNGLLVAVLARPGAAGAPLPDPELEGVGLDVGPEALDDMAAALGAELRREGSGLRDDPEWLRSTMNAWLREQMRRRLRRRPVVLAHVVEP